MSEEDKSLQARIVQLAGQINRRKSQQHQAASPIANSHPAHHRHTKMMAIFNSPSVNSWRGGYSQYRVGRPSIQPNHRNRTLVLNGTSTPPDPLGPSPGPGPGLTTVPPADGSSSSSSPPHLSTTSWVSKNDRHRQLINSAVYEKDSQARIKAMETSRLQKLRTRDRLERNKLMLISSGQAGPANPPAAVSSGRHAPAVEVEIEVGGVPFRLTKGGSKLVKIPGRINSGNSTPKTAHVAGVKFYRSKNGNLYRSGVVKAQRQSGVVKTNEPCRIFSSTGSCPKGPACRYTHDPAGVAICKDFLLRGGCTAPQNCDLSHEPTPERTPACLHFAKGNCTNPTCIYAHSAVSAGALVCRSFGLNGYCQKGASCEERHVLFECPDFTNTGKCRIKGCKLAHRERASHLRKAQAAGGARNTADGSSDNNDADDLSSDDESVDSDDVDSDAVEEFIGDDRLGDTDFGDQKDYIAF